MTALQEKLHLALHYFNTGQPESAEPLFRQVLESQPDNPEALHFSGLLAYHKGDSCRAIDLVSKALVVAPEYANAHHNLGIIQENLGDLDKALMQYEQAIRINPAYVDACCSLARTLQKQGRLNEAAGQFEKVIEFSPFHEQALISLATILGRQGDPQGAIRYYQKAIEVNPANLNTINNLGVVLRESGQLKQAVEAFRHILQQNPCSGSACFNLAQIEPSLHASETESIHQALRQPGLAEDDRMYFHYALGLVHNKAQSYDSAITHVKKANAIQRSKITYDSESESLLFESIKQHFTKNYFEEQPTYPELASESPVFIIGMPRTGTTLVEQILATHPLAHGGGEMLLLDSLLARVIDRHSLAESLAEIDEKTIKELARGYLEQLTALAPDKKVISNKKVDNYLFLGVIARMFPQAKIIHCRRDALDNCLSCFMTWFHTGQFFSYDMQELGEYYQAYDQLMNHWREALPIPMLEVQYEELIDNPEAISREIIAYCGLDWDPQCLLFHQNTRSVYTASDLQVRQPLYKSSMGRARHYEEHLLPLKKALELADGTGKVGNTCVQQAG